MRSPESGQYLQNRRGEVIVNGTAGYDIYGIIDPGNLGQEKVDGNVLLAEGQGGANVGRTVQSLDVPVRLATTVGTDSMSTLLTASLQEKGLRLAVVEDPEYPLPVSSIRIVSTNPPRREIIRNTFPKDYKHRTALTEGDISNAGVLFEASQKGNHIEVVQKRLVIAREKNVPIVYAPGRSQIDAADALFYETWEASTLAATNEEESKKTTGKTFHEKSVESLMIMRDMGADNVIVTKGMDGVSAIDREGNIYEGNIYNKSISGNGYIDGTGAGDRFIATVVAMQLRGDSLPVALGKASINGRSVVEHLGAQKGLLKPGEINEIYEANPDYRVKVIANVGPRAKQKERTTIATAGKRG